MKQVFEQLWSAIKIIGTAAFAWIIAGVILSFFVSGCGALITRDSASLSSDSHVCTWALDGITENVRDIARVEIVRRNIDCPAVFAEQEREEAVLKAAASPMMIYSGMNMLNSLNNRPIYMPQRPMVIINGR